MAQQRADANAGPARESAPPKRTCWHVGPGPRALSVSVTAGLRWRSCCLCSGSGGDGGAQDAEGWRGRGRRAEFVGVAIGSPELQEHLGVVRELIQSAAGADAFAVFTAAWPPGWPPVHESADRACVSRAGPGSGRSARRRFDPGILTAELAITVLPGHDWWTRGWMLRLRRGRFRRGSRGIRR